jgi:hypothetical protein
VLVGGTRISKDGLRRRSLLIVCAMMFILFFFTPFLPIEWASPAGLPIRSAWVSPSFALFQCGSFVGSVAIQVTGNAVVGLPVPFWVASSNWNCQFPRPTWVQ